MDNVEKVEEGVSSASSVAQSSAEPPPIGHKADIGDDNSPAQRRDLARALIGRMCHTGQMRLNTDRRLTGGTGVAADGGWCQWR